LRGHVVHQFLKEVRGLLGVEAVQVKGIVAGGTVQVTASIKQLQ